MMLGGSRWSMMPPVVKNLLIINGLMYLAAITFQQSAQIDLWEMFGLHYFESQHFRFYQVVTYMFMHGNFSHLFFNMFAVWMFGSTIEQVWGSKRFLIYYLLTGFGAAFLHYLIIAIDLYPVTSQLNAIFANPDANSIIAFAKSHNWSDFLDPHIFPSQYAIAERFVSTTIPVLQANPTDTQLISESVEFLRSYFNFLVDSQNVVGASGSLFGILLAFGMMFPNAELYMIFLPIPIKAKYFVMGYGAIELLSALQNNPFDNVAHFAHLGGMLFGFVILKFWEKAGIRWR